MRGSKRLLAIVALIALIGLPGPRAARADGPSGFGVPGRPRGFHDGYRPGFPRRGGMVSDDHFRRRKPRYCWCGFDFYRDPRHHHRHDDSFRFPPFPYRGHF